MLATTTKCVLVYRILIRVDNTGRRQANGACSERRWSGIYAQNSDKDSATHTAAATGGPTRIYAPRTQVIFTLCDALTDTSTSHAV
jgi:hypothetical protein